jgi:hypothetical protein
LFLYPLKSHCHLKGEKFSLGRRDFGPELGQAAVKKFRSCFCQHDVSWLQVAVDNTVTVGGI